MCLQGKQSEVRRMSIEQSIEELMSTILKRMKELDEPNELGMIGINSIKSDINYRVEKLQVIVKALRLIRCETFDQGELLNTFKNIDGTLKSIERGLSKRSMQDSQ